MSSNVPSAASGRARSCTGCRQVKLACDARKTAPQPCSRCKNKGLQCKFDSNFKRIPMRRVAQEITNGLHNLLPGTSSPASAASPAASPRAEDPFSIASIGVEAGRKRVVNISKGRSSTPSNTRSRPWLNAVQNDYFVNYSFGNVTIDTEVTFTLLKNFESFYLPHAPFLARIDSVYDFAIRSPLLFWTILLIAAREHDKDDGLSEQISIAQGVLLSHLMQFAIIDIEDIHALLLLCIWPVPKVHEQHDPSWEYIGMATNAAMQLNCHNPNSEPSTTQGWKGMTTAVGSGVDVETAAFTWIYCFKIGARIGAALGLPPPLAAPAQLRSVFNLIKDMSRSMSEEQRTIAEILKLACLSTLEVDDATDVKTRHSLIQMFDSQFDALAQTSATSWTREVCIELLGSKLYLYALLLTMETNEQESSQEQQVYRQIVLLRIQDASLRLISNMTELSNTAVADGFYPAGALSFYPRHYFTLLYMATSCLFRFLAAYQGITQQDIATVVHGLMDGHRIFQSMVEHQDSIKAAITIQYLVDLVRHPDIVHPHPLKELAITNRLGASITFDASFRFAFMRNQRHNAFSGVNAPAGSWLSGKLVSRPRHSSTPEQKSISPGHGSGRHGLDEGHVQRQLQQLSPWTPWDTYMNDFYVDESVLSQLDSLTQSQSLESGSPSTMPALSHQDYTH